MIQHLIFLSILLPALPVRADEALQPLPTLNVDLDGDQVPDQLRVLPAEGERLALEIRLSASGKTGRYERLLRRLDGSTCGTMGSNELRAGPGRSFLLIRSKGDVGICRYEERTELEIALGAGGLGVVRARVRTNSWSMGGPAPKEDILYDFAARSIRVSIDESQERNVHATRAEKMSAGCSARLAELEENGELPLCATRQAWFMGEEIMPNWTKDGAKVCPRLDGSYLCTRRYGNHSFRTRVVVIHRGENKINVYDISEQDRRLVADAQRRRYERDDQGPLFQTVSCRRDSLRIKEEAWLRLPAGDSRKALFDRKPWRVESGEWLQQDIEGTRFSYVERTAILEDGGAYRRPEVRSMECVKEADPE